jgi:hypothetical protein
MGIDLGKRAQVFKPGHDVAQFIGFKQLELDLVASLLALRRERLVHDVAGGNALACRESIPAPV